MSRAEQLRLAKRAQRAREKRSGLQTVHLRVPAACGDALRIAARAPGFAKDIERYLRENLVDLADAPVLRDLLWSGRAPRHIPAAEAFRIYERNWRFVSRARLDGKEKDLIERLARQHGAGLING